MRYSFDTSSSSLEELRKLEEIIHNAILKREKFENRKQLSPEERKRRLANKDSKNENICRIWDEYDEKSIVLKCIPHGKYKLVRAAELRLAISRKGVARWFGGFKEGEQAYIEPMIHSSNGDVLVCGSDAFKLQDDDFQHPRFVI